MQMIWLHIHCHDLNIVSPCCFQKQDLTEISVIFLSKHFISVLCAPLQMPERSSHIVRASLVLAWQFRFNFYKEEIDFAIHLRSKDTEFSCLRTNKYQKYLELDHQTYVIFQI